ncbi:hypothetical protein [Janthinobacterium sp. 78]|uniref:hypothetical protein n=2 Tax=unclassified Janthinobacterium TaxID=2610881 RepID=UPI000C188530|nr:hypothetical protein [Janthinobacterium sp. 78]
MAIPSMHAPRPGQRRRRGRQDRSQLAFSTHIVAGELLFTILDTAELLGCHEIVPPALRHGPWQRRFAGALARKLARATRSATVLLADTDGMSGPPPA